MFGEEEYIPVSFEKVYSETDKGICIQSEGRICWLPKRYVEVGDNSVEVPDWIKMEWRDVPKKKRKPKLDERIQKTMKELKRLCPGISLGKKRGKYVVRVNGRKKHWGDLCKKEAHAVLTTILSLVGDR